MDRNEHDARGDEPSQGGWTRGDKMHAEGLEAAAQAPDSTRGIAEEIGREMDARPAGGTPSRNDGRSGTTANETGTNRTTDENASVGRNSAGTSQERNR
ncbi:MAG TPA: hypothetical protein VFE05_12835 [Longimicrobiaceae bacterium]|jgi:hypothetical protein|nr:hypothetical protein [Longimicrobiaceae bacterium]